MRIRIASLLLISIFYTAQAFAQTIVFKVRAPKAECTIFCQESFFWLEADNPVRIKVNKGNEKRIRVEVLGGQIVSSENDTYNVRFIKTGLAVISVYKLTTRGRELIATKSQAVKNPDIYFCGIKIDSVSKFLKLRGPNIYAYSDYYKKNMQILSFEMVFVDDTLRRNKKPIRFKSDTCMITPEMKNIIAKFQPNFNYVYLHKIICRVPDGSKRILDPVEFDIDVDTTDTEKLSLVFLVKRKAL